MPSRSLARWRERNICWCPPSWPRKATWVKTTPSRTAASDWNQLAPSHPNQQPGAGVSADGCRDARRVVAGRRSSRRIAVICRHSAAKSLPRTASMAVVIGVVPLFVADLCAVCDRRMNPACGAAGQIASGSQVLARMALAGLS